MPRRAGSRTGKICRIAVSRVIWRFCRADGFVVVRGGIGTLSEVTLAWSLLQTRPLNGGTPLVLLGAEWQAVLDSLLAHTNLRCRSVCPQNPPSPSRHIHGVHPPTR